MRKWLDRKIEAYQEKAFKKYEEMQQTHAERPETFKPAALNAMQGAQGHYNPADAAALSSPETAQFLGEPQAEQLRQMQELQAHGQRMKQLWDNGTDVELTVTAVEPTGITLGGQRQFAIQVQVNGLGDTYAARCVQVIPDPMMHTYGVGARFQGKVDPANRADVGIFQKLG